MYLGLVFCDDVDVDDHDHEMNVFYFCLIELTYVPMCDVSCDFESENISCPLDNYHAICCFLGFASGPSQIHAN